LFDKKFSIVMGQSGVGKTTFINNISNNNYKTQQISKSLLRAKHTTTSAKIISFLNGFLIDSPGFSSLDVEKEINLNKSYLNFKELAKLCKFKDCMHNFEKNCNVK
ncbi:ribosome small subunit-dependent GTPase A, partial [Mycoplasmopsis synoviae]|uniref:ribosome small subunit-dependent GTPase A n=1 Tax=Mycoplasmopsis synoviae TaxID=2109 RepID=UPI00387B2291